VITKGGLNMRAHFLEPLLDATCDAGAVVVTSRRPATPVAGAIETGFDSASRRRGLLGRDGLPRSTAMVLAPCSAIHTWGMRFSIDVIFAARDGRIVKLCRNVRPRRAAVAWRAFAAIEMTAGTIDAAGLTIGDRLQIARARERA
jgi:uncharacterized membrane protein (UPF0127 family)